MNTKWLKSLTDIGFIPYVTSYDDLSNDEPRTYLTKKAEESMDVVTIDTLDKLVEDQFCINVTDKNAHFCIESLFVSYQLLLRRNGLSWLTKDNERISVYHVLSATHPASLRTRLESDLELSHYGLRKDIKIFMAHVVKLSEAF